MAKEKKGRFLSIQGGVTAFDDEGFMVELNGKMYVRTIRTSQCDILIHGENFKCESCRQFWPTVRAMYSRWLKKLVSPQTPKKFAYNRYLNTPEKLKKLK